MNGRFLIFCPIGAQSGGAEALHQLCDALNSLDEKAYLVPMGEANHPHPAFSIYGAPMVEDPEFRSDDVVVIPEVLGRLPRKFDLNIPKQVFVWWLSVDYASHPIAHSLERRSNKLHPEWGAPSRINLQRFKSRVKGILDFSERRIDQSKYPALAQSDYAKNFLREKLGINALMVGDYLNTQEIGADFSPNPRPVVLYNPLKGKELADVLIQMLPEYDFKPIRDMTKNEVSKALHSADLYLDLGFFPGRDRLAREAVIQHCPILIAKRGAARSEVDFNLPQEFKVDVAIDSPRAVAAKMKAILADREAANAALLSFREEVLSDFTVFMGEVKQFVNSI